MRRFTTCWVMVLPPHVFSPDLILVIMARIMALKSTPDAIEFVVFNGQKSLGQPGGHFLLSHEETTFPVKLADQTAVSGKYVGDKGRAIVRDFTEARQVAACPEVHAAGNAAAEQAAGETGHEKKTQNASFPARTGSFGRRCLTVLGGGGRSMFLSRQIPVRVLSSGSICFSLSCNGVSGAKGRLCSSGAFLRMKPFCPHIA